MKIDFWVDFSVGKILFIKYLHDLTSCSIKRFWREKLYELVLMAWILSGLKKSPHHLKHSSYNWFRTDKDWKSAVKT